MLKTVKCNNIPQADLLSDADPYLVITQNDLVDFKYQSPVEHNKKQFEVTLDVMLLMRENSSITINLRDDDMILSQGLFSLTITKEQLDAALQMNENRQMEAKFVNTPDQKIPAFSIETTFLREKWSQAYIDSIEANLKPDQVRLSSLDPFTKLLFKSIIMAIKSGDMDTKTITADKVAVPTFPPGSQRLAYLHDVEWLVLAHDQEFPASVGQQALLNVLNHLPFCDDQEYFVNALQAKDFIARLYNEDEFLLAAPEGPWENDTSDDSFSRYVFSNNGAVFVEKIDSGYMIDLDTKYQMPSLEIRDGFIKYGGVAYFDQKMNPVRIVIEDYCVYPESHYEKDTWDESKQLTFLWEHAKLRIRSSIFPLCSAEHLMGVHFGWATIPNQALRTHLPSDHPIRRLLHIHYYRSALTVINSLSSLLPKNGLLHRSTALTIEALRGLFATTLANWEYVSFPEELKRRGFNDLRLDDYPLSTDAVDYHSFVVLYVSEYMDIYYETDEKMHADIALNSFYRMVRQRLRGLPRYLTLTKHDMASVLGEFIFRVSGYHEHVGNVNVAGLSPSMICPALKSDQLMSGISSAVIVGAITATTTAQFREAKLQNYPNICDDWSHLFQDRLRDFGQEIDRRNKIRRWVNCDFHPKFVNTSVSS
jgi:hypothetical protein